MVQCGSEGSMLKPSLGLVIYALPWIMNGKLDNRKKLLLPFKDFYSWRCMYAHAYTNAHKRTHTHKHTRTGTCTHTNLDTTFTLPGSCGSYDTQGREKENWTGMLETIQAFFHSLCLLKGNMYICLLWLCPITSRRALRSAMFSTTNKIHLYPHIIYIVTAKLSRSLHPLPKTCPHKTPCLIWTLVIQALALGS